MLAPMTKALNKPFVPPRSKNGVTSSSTPEATTKPEKPKSTLKTPKEIIQISDDEQPTSKKQKREVEEPVSLPSPVILGLLTLNFSNEISAPETPSPKSKTTIVVSRYFGKNKKLTKQLFAENSNAFSEDSPSSDTKENVKEISNENSISNLRPSNDIM